MLIARPELYYNNNNNVHLSCAHQRPERFEGGSKVPTGRACRYNRLTVLQGRYNSADKIQKTLFIPLREITVLSRKASDWKARRNNDAGSSP